MAKTLLPASGTFATIQGRVINKSTNAPLANANIVLIGTQWGAATDSNGYYRLERLPPGKYTIQASLIGFETQTVHEVILQDGEVQTSDFWLTPKSLKGDSVVVEAERPWENYQTNVSMVGMQKMTAREIIELPGAFDDPIRAITVRSGSAGAGDFNSFLVMRGSSPEQSLVVLNGAVIPNPHRFRLAWGGGLSVFDPLTTQNVRLYLGGYPAEYGNALSSVLEVETRAGSLTRFSGGGAVNLTDAGGTIEGPIWKGKASFLVTARRTYLDLVAKRLSNSNSVYPYFHDFANKWFWQWDEKNKITLFLSTSREKADLPSELSKTLSIAEEAKTRLAILSWKSFFSNRSQLETVISYYHDAMAFQSYNPIGHLTTSDYKNLNSRSDRLAFVQNFRCHLTAQSWLNFGLYGAWVDAQIDFRSVGENFYFARNEFPQEIRFDKMHRYYAAYVENVSELSKKLQLRAGLRVDHATLIQESELSPRLTLWYKWNERTTVEGSWGVFYQYPDPLTVSIRDQPLDIGASLDFITAEKATHSILGINRKLATDLAVSLAFYNIDMDRLLLPEDRVTFKPFNDGRGIARGVEFVLEKLPSAAHRSSGLISYSFGISRNQNRHSREWIPFNYDRRHGLTLWYHNSIGKCWNLSLLWRLASGLPYTNVLGARLTESHGGRVEWNFVRGTRNEKRLPSYQRLDARLSYQAQTDNRKLSFYLDFINLYNYKNVYNLTWERTSDAEFGTPENIAKRRTIYMLPFLPSFGMQLRF